MTECGKPNPDTSRAITPRFPIYATVFGVASVVITETEYARLKQRDKPSARAHRLSSVDKDPEVRDFILARLGTQDVDQIRLLALDTFGAGRVPSKSSVSRFVVKMRAAGLTRDNRAPR